jgi:hypothetical protein
MLQLKIPRVENRYISHILYLRAQLPIKSTRKVEKDIKRTFKLDTRSAVSSRVNVLIWSTIWAILGLVGAAAAGAASVDSHRRLLGVRRAVRYVAEVAMRREDGRTEPESCLQQRAAAWVGKDMAKVKMRRKSPERED